MAIYRTNFSAPSRPLPKHIHTSGTVPMNLFLRKLWELDAVYIWLSMRLHSHCGQGHYGEEDEVELEGYKGKRWA